ncbi:DUF6881 domain-containing protein [uncultured Oscillibacter sp.]|uniref:DUF6881 domain-containing protein n=1 Tax=uncultured Oscillibacter sp. TaxID=876091 RepID=UPI0025D7BA83|nr:hypothetical protein [uncultured Oscillibacter sp.]
MEYVLIERETADIDEPLQIYSELDENRREVRRVEFYDNGLTHACGGSFGREEALAKDPFPADLRTLAVPGEVTARAIPAAFFREVWSQVQERPDGFMGMFF